MLPTDFVVAAILLRLLSGASYIRATWQGKAHPSLVSWGFWSLTALIAFGVQIVQGSGPEAFVTLAIGLSPLAVCIVAIAKGAHKTRLTSTDKWCILLTLIGIGMWLTSKNPLLALGMSIVADIFSNIPTILKGYRNPQTEHATAYLITVASMAVTLLTITNWHVTNWLFAAYILAINLVIVLSITVCSRLRGSWWPSRLSARLAAARNLS